VVTGTRFYQFAGRTVAVRTGSGLSFQFTDAHATNQASVDAQTGTIAWWRTTPYGGTRGGQPSTWPSQKGFVGGTRDPGSGLIHLGAREYDPAIGRFISVDPVFNGEEPQTWNGYAYGNNNPLANTDQDGRRVLTDGGDCGCGAVPLPLQHAWDNFWNNINKIQNFTIVTAIVAVVSVFKWIGGLFSHEATADEKADAAGVVGSEEGAEKAVDVAIELQATREGIPKDMGTTSVVKVWDSETGEYIIKVAVETTAVKEMPAGWEEIIRKTYGSEIAIEFVKNPGTSREHDHAEETIIGSLGDTQVIVEGGASRNVCLYQCNADLPVDINLGGRTWPFRGEKTPFRAFWRTPPDPFNGQPIGGGDWGMTP
jgi:RHS repeat-associated protein